jgi:hypothetical protein
MMNHPLLAETLIADRRRRLETEAHAWRLGRLSRRASRRRPEAPAAQDNVVVLPRRSPDDQVAA